MALTDKWKLVLGFEYFLTTLTTCHAVSFHRTAESFFRRGRVYIIHMHNTTRDGRETKSHAQLNRERGVGVFRLALCPSTTRLETITMAISAPQ